MLIQSLAALPNEIRITFYCNLCRKAEIKTKSDNAYVFVKLNLGKVLQNYKLKNIQKNVGATRKCVV